MPLAKGQTSPKMNAAARARSATGFLKAGDQHTVSVQGIGVVYTGRNKRDADRAEHRWTKLSRDAGGRAFGKAVIHITNKPNP